jgi:hypothetical protein
MAVERCHDAGGIAGNVEHDAGDTAAIGAAIIDARHKDQHCGRIEPQREGERDQYRHAVDGADAGECAYDRAEKAAEDREGEVGRRNGDREPLGERR